MFGGRNEMCIVSGRTGSGDSRYVSRNHARVRGTGEIEMEKK